mgnify:CR=1 FL=1
MLCGLDKPGRVAERRPISQGPGDYIILIISLAIKIQTMIVALSGNTTRPRDARASSTCFIILPPLVVLRYRLPTLSRSY